MKSRQICAGHVPPNTVMRVRGGSIGIDPSWKPTHTAAVSWGTAPTNHAFVWVSAVPVLPIWGRPMIAERPVP